MPVGRGDDDVVDVVDLLGHDLVGLVDQGRVERVLAPAEQPEGPDVVRLAAQGQDVAADVGVRVVDGVLHLLERHVVLAEQPGVDQDLVLLDRPAVAGHVDDAGDRLQGALEDPVLHGLELVGGVAGAFQHVADDLAGRAPGREPRLTFPAGGWLTKPIRLMTSCRADQ